MKDITIDGVTLTYDERTNYYIEYNEDGSINGMIDGSFGEDEAIKTFKGARAECRLAKKFINDLGFEIGFEKWCHFSTKDRKNFYNELCLKYCPECDILYDCDCSNTEKDRELCLLEKLEEDK